MPKKEFLAAACTARERLLAAVTGLDDEIMTTRRISGTWTGKDILGHLAAVDGMILDAAQQAHRGDTIKWAYEGYADFDEMNAAEARKRHGSSVAAVRAEFNDNRKALVAELESWPADSGPFGPDSWDVEKSPVGWLASHELEHEEAFRTPR